MGTRAVEFRVYDDNGAPYVAATAPTTKVRYWGDSTTTPTPTHIADGVWATTVDDTKDAVVYWSGTGILADHLSVLRLPAALSFLDASVASRATQASVDVLSGVVTEGVPHYTTPTVATRTIGDNDGGTVTDLAANDDTYFIVGEVVGAGLQADLVIPTDPTHIAATLDVVGRYQGGASHTVTASVYNNVTAAWDPKFTMSHRTEDHTYSAPIGAQYQAVNGDVLVRYEHSAGTYIASHALHLNTARVGSVEANEELLLYLAAIFERTNQLNFVGGDVKATLDGEVAAANLVQIDGVANADASLTLRHVRVQNDAGTAVELQGGLSALSLYASQIALDIAGGVQDVRLVTQSHNLFDILLERLVAVGSVGKLIADALTALTPGRAAKLDNLDAPVSTRLAADGYTAPNNAAIAAVAGTVAANLDAAVSSRPSLADMEAAALFVATVDTTGKTFVSNASPGMSLCTDDETPANPLAGVRVDAYLASDVAFADSKRHTFSDGDGEWGLFLDNGADYVLVFTAPRQVTATVEVSV